jgi:hypothetical protein
MQSGSLHVSLETALMHDAGKEGFGMPMIGRGSDYDGFVTDAWPYICSGLAEVIAKKEWQTYCNKRVVDVQENQQFASRSGDTN